MSEIIHIPPVPDFSLGDTPDVREYVTASVGEFCERVDLASDARARMLTCFLNALRENPSLLELNDKPGITEVAQEARALRDCLGDILMRPESRLFGGEHFEDAQRHMEEGGNVFADGNHTSIADMLAFEALTRDSYGHEVMDDCVYVSGGPMNEPSLQQIISGGFHRLPVYSKKSQSNGDIDPNFAKDANGRNMISFARYASKGGRFGFIYPEGTRSEGGMLRANPTSSGFPKVMAGKKRDLRILPVRVDGARENILSIDSDDPNEHSTFLQRCTPGIANITFGPLTSWSEVVKFSSDSENKRIYSKRNLIPDGINPDDPDAVSAAIASDVMGGIVANIDLDQEYDGAYGDTELGGFVERFEG